MGWSLADRDNNPILPNGILKDALGNTIADFSGGSGGGDIALQAGDQIVWAGDTILLRAEADHLRTPDKFSSQADIVAQANAANQVTVGGLPGGPGIIFGSGGDTNLYRSAANVLASDDSIRVVGGAGESSYFGAAALGAAGSAAEIGSLGDPNGAYMRAIGSGANVSARIRPKGTGESVLEGSAGTPKVRVNETGVGFYNATPVAQVTITGSRGGNAALADLLTKLATTGLIVDGTSA